MPRALRSGAFFSANNYRTWGIIVSPSEFEGAASAAPSRRSAVKGAAWSVPVIAAAIAAPAASASTVKADLAIGRASSPRIFRLPNHGLFGAEVVTESIFNVINVGTTTSLGGETVIVTYEAALGAVTLSNFVGGVVITRLDATSFLATLPPLSPGGNVYLLLGFDALPDSAQSSTANLMATLTSGDQNPENDAYSITAVITVHEESQTPG